MVAVGFGGEWIHLCVWVSPFDITITTVLIGYIPIKNKKLKKNLKTGSNFRWAKGKPQNYSQQLQEKTGGKHC